MITPADILSLTHGIQQDIRAAEKALRQANGKLVTVRSWIASQPHAQPPPTEYTCHICDLDKRSRIALEDHLANVHGHGDDELVPLPDEPNTGDDDGG